MNPVGDVAAQAAQRILMQQLTSQLAESAMPGDDAAQQQVRSLFAQTLADAVAGPQPTRGAGA